MDRWCLICGFEGTINIRPHGQAVKTSPFHGGNTSSNLVGVIGVSLEFGALAQLVRAIGS